MGFSLGRSTIGAAAVMQVLNRKKQVSPRLHRPPSRIWQVLFVPFRRIVLPLVLRGRRIARRLRLDVCIIEGKEAVGGEPLSVFCAGASSYPLQLAFGDNRRKHYEGRVWLWNLRRAIREKGQGCALLLVTVRRPYLRLMRPGNSFVIPAWVRGEIAIPLGPSVTKQKSVKSDLRRIRKNQLEFVVTKDPEQFNDFYHHMYVPHITQAHGRSAFIWRLEAMARKFEECELLLVRKKEQSIAGILITYAKPTPRLWSLGVLNGDRRYLKDGAIGALLSFTFEHLERNGHRVADFGLTRPFLDDGGLRYKKKWGLTIVGTSSDCFVLEILSPTPGACAFLRSHPFIFCDRGALSGAIFVDSGWTSSPEELQRINLQHSIPGIAKLRLYRLVEASAVEIEAIPWEPH